MNQVHIGEIVEILNGYAFDSKLFNSEGRGLPIARIRDVVRGRSETYTTEDCPSNYVIDNGDLLVGMDGEFNIAFWRGGKAVLNQRVCRVTGKPGIADNTFLKYRLAVLLKRIENNTPFVTVKHLSSEKLKIETIELPPLPEQQRIATILSQADRLRRLRRTARELSDTYLESMFVHLFGDPGIDRKEWDVVSVEEILSKDRRGTQTGPFGSSLKRHEYVEEGIPVWGIDNVRENEFVERDSLFITPAKYRERGRHRKRRL